MATTQFLTDLQTLLEARKPLVHVIEFETIPIYLDRLNYQDQTALVLWMLENGAQWSNDQERYQGYENTFHLWLDTPEIHLCCGFQFKGQAPENNYAFTIYNDGNKE